MVLATALIAALALASSGGGALTSPTTPRRRSAPPVTSSLPAYGQQALLADGRVVVALAARRASRVAVVVRLEGGPGPLAIGSRRVALRATRSRSLSFALSPAARAAIAGCVPHRLTVVLTSLGSHAGSAVRNARDVTLDPPECARFFAPGSIWNAPLAPDAALDRDSAAITGQLVDEVEREFRSGPPPNINTSAYSVPIYTVGRDQPTVPVKLDLPRGSVPDLEASFAAVPVPPGARAAAGTDASMVVWQPSTDRLWEFWQMRYGGTGWHAAWGGHLPQVSTGPGHFQAPTANWGATATSLPLVGGLMTLAELRAGHIDHALALAMPGTRQGVFSLPAQRTDGASSNPSAVPQGARLRLDPTLDLDVLGLPPLTLMMARAAQRYGIIVRDTAANIAFYGEDPTPSGTDPYPALYRDQPPSQLLRRFPWSSLRLLKLQLRDDPFARRPGLLACGLLGCPLG